MPSPVPVAVGVQVEDRVFTDIQNTTGALIRGRRSPRTVSTSPSPIPLRSRGGHRHMVRTLIRRRNTTPMGASLSRNPWEWIYATRAMDAVGWYEPDPFTSRELVAEAVARGARSIIDVGGGASRLVDHLVDLDLDRVEILDIPEAGLALARHRLGTRADALEVSGIATAFVGATFTLAELRAVYEAIWEVQLDAANFRRSVIAEDGWVIPTGRRARPGPAGGRPAELFRAGRAWSHGGPIRR